MRENLRNARIEKGMTQKQVAKYLHTAERYYKQIEYGERLGSMEKSHWLVTIRLLLSLLGISV